jgi:outer membrane receptor for monomeric catechols
VPGINALAGAQRVDGFEAAVSGGEDGVWNAGLAYTYLDSHQTGTTTGGPLLNAPLVNTPKDEVTANVQYNILEVWSVGAGGQYVSKRLAQNTAASYLTGPPYFTWTCSRNTASTRIMCCN